VTRQVTLPDGTRVLIRPIEPSDREALADGFAQLSPESRYLRFFAPMKELGAQELDYLTQVDHRDHEALVAQTEGGEGVGVARYVRTAPGEAEPAVVVADDWQQRGIGTALLDALTDRAREEGVECFRALVLARNTDAIALLERLGSSRVSHLGREVEVEVEITLTPAPQARPTLRTLLREVAAGTLKRSRRSGED
jgi:RimJ/RimL family protein N-acetyltransferase